LRTLTNRGIQTGVTLIPVLPFIEDNEEKVIQIVEQAHAHGASYIIPCFGMTLRDRQRSIITGAWTNGSPASGPSTRDASSRTGG